MLRAIAMGASGLVWLAVMMDCAAGQAGPSYPAMAPISQYLMASPDEEISLARSAAPSSISGDAEILVLGPDGYKTVVKGKNGFVCLVERSWDAEFVNPVFWNQNVRGPDCLNPAAARSILPHFIERTKWALAGLSIAQMIANTKAEVAAKEYVLPESGAMAFMMSREQHLADQSPFHWHPHLMFFVANTNNAAWGANLPGSPVFHPFATDPDPITTFFVPIRNWSDGTPDDMTRQMHQH